MHRLVELYARSEREDPKSQVVKPMQVISASSLLHPHWMRNNWILTLAMATPSGTHC